MLSKLYTSKIKKGTLVVIADEKGKFQYRESDQAAK